MQKYQPDVFKCHFRLSRSAVTELEISLQPLFKMVVNNYHVGRSNINLKDRILLTLWTLSNIESFRGISDRFGVGKGTAHGIFLETCHLIATLDKIYIKWPSCYEKSASEFKALRGIDFQGIIGAVDGVDIPIVAPIEDKPSYYNRKGIYSIKMQGICDSSCKFIDVFIGFPGSCHDAYMWKESPIYNKIKNQLNKEFHLIGDSAYPLDIFLMKPYRDNGHLTRQQQKFNYLLSSHRVVIENAYGILKGKFRRIKYLHMFKIESIPKVIMACAILHNIAIEGRDFENALCESDCNDVPYVVEMDGIENDSDGRLKRDYLCAMLNRVVVDE